MGNMKIAKDVTRVDLERIPGENIVLVSLWHGEWQPGSTPAHKEVLQDASLLQLLEGLENMGFTVEMAKSDTGRALRGKITRIDFTRTDAGWRVKRYPHGWTAKTRPIQDETSLAFDLPGALSWCKDNGWTVHTWQASDNHPAGHRAFRGDPQPVRDASTIRAMRRRMPDEQYDFMFDC